MRILVVEPDATVAQSIEMMLRSERFNVTVVSTGAEAFELATLYDYNLITMALDLPDMSGYDVIKQLRQTRCNTPILICSGLAGIEDKVKGLGIGADDYLTKPFHKDELVARIHAIVRRSKGLAQNVVTVGDVVVNFSNRTVHVAGTDAGLTGKEYQMLELMALRKGATITKEMFLSHLYGGMNDPDIKIIDVFICKLRKKLPAGTVETIWGRGYVLRDPEGAEQGSGSLASELSQLVNSPPWRVGKGGSLVAHDKAKMARVSSPPLAPVLP
jgi:two-component system cell cycle response regulator CtrA